MKATYDWRLDSARYHGECDRHLQIKAAQMGLRSVPDLAMTAPHCAAGRRAHGRIRVGFISKYFAVCVNDRNVKLA